MASIVRAPIAALILLFAAAVVPAIAEGDSPPPPIREFDIATVEKLGREMYEQDQLAWKATDIVRQRISEADQKVLRGWIVVKHGAANRVRFMREGPHGVEVGYDVEFQPGAEPAFSQPADHALAGEDRAQYDARQLALKTMTRRCPPAATYNTIALRDTDGAGWLVWTMAATTQPGIIVMGGHDRFMISADGTRVVQHDPLSRGCLVIDMPQREKATHIVTAHYVSLTPVETYPFVSLGLPYPLYVGTLDSRTWKVDRGHITTVDMDMPEADGFAARTIAGTEEACKVLVEGTDGKFYFTTGEVKVINDTEHAEKYTTTAPAEGKISSIMCVRHSIVPAPNDYKVLVAGYTLAILDNGKGHPSGRILWLEMKAGRLSVRMSKGELTSDEQQRVQARVDRMQTAMDGKRQ